MQHMFILERLFWWKPFFKLGVFLLWKNHDSMSTKTYEYGSFRPSDDVVGLFSALFLHLDDCFGGHLAAPFLQELQDPLISPWRIVRKDKLAPEYKMTIFHVVNYWWYVLKDERLILSIVILHGYKQTWLFTITWLFQTGGISFGKKILSYAEVTTIMAQE